MPPFADVLSVYHNVPTPPTKFQTLQYDNISSQVANRCTCIFDAGCHGAAAVTSCLSDRLTRKRTRTEEASADVFTCFVTMFVNLFTISGHYSGCYSGQWT